MTQNEFNIGLIGEPLKTADGNTRIRYIIADAVSLRATERQQDGRPDKAGQLRFIAMRLRSGQYPTKRVMRKTSKDISIVETRLVDGISIAGL